MAELLRVDEEGWRKELPDIEDFYDRFGDRVPDALRTGLSQLDNRLTAGERRARGPAMTVCVVSAPDPGQR